METVDKFYFTYFGGISLPFNKSREELVSINKEAIRFLINDIKLYKDMAIRSRVRVESLSIDAVEPTNRSGATTILWVKAVETPTTSTINSRRDRRSMKR
jgi:hypothetical protein